jgi:hypothetical protein
MRPYDHEARALLALLPSPGTAEWGIVGAGQFSLPSLDAPRVSCLRSALSFYLTTCESQQRKAKGTSFPLEYKGWRIEIKSGADFGARGSVKGKRGYIATRLSDGKTHKLAPSYDVSPTLAGVKQIIDIEERR